MTSIPAESRPRVALRPLALPAEHGGWGFLLEPLLLALIVAPSVRGALIAIAAVAVFLMRHPLKFAARDWMLRKRYPRTAACEILAAAYAVVAVAALAPVGFRPLIALSLAAPFGALQFAYDLRNRGRELVAELAGAIAPGAAASAMALAGGKPAAMALALWLLMIARGIPAILYVRSALHRRAAFARLAHVIALGVVAGLWFVHAAPLTAIVAMTLLLARTFIPVGGLRAQTIGFREIGYGAATVLLIAAGYRL